jgi:hypothetical protein
MKSRRFAWTEIAGQRKVLHCSDCGSSMMLVVEAPLAKKGSRHNRRMLAKCAVCGPESYEHVIEWGPAGKNK